MQNLIDFATGPGAGVLIFLMWGLLAASLVMFLVWLMSRR